MDDQTLGMNKDDLDTPVLLIDLESMEDNIARMAGFLNKTSTSIRPHFKTHKSPLIARKQLLAGAIGITCQKLGEAEVLVDSGLSDILIASQIIGQPKLIRLAQLARRAWIAVAADHPANIRELSAAAQQAGSTLRIVIEIDVGFGRCGVSREEEALTLVRLVNELPNLEFAGVMGYEGHAVFLTDSETRSQTVDQAMAKLTRIADFIRAAGIRVGIVSGGATGTYNLTGRYPGVTEIEAGSYVLMDTRYRGISSEFKCALTLLATVISVPTVDRAVIDVGKKALSTDFGMPEITGRPGVQVKALSEEHGILQVDPTQTRFQVGDKVELIPSHVCTTVNLHDYFYVIHNGCLEAIWPIEARGKYR